MPSTTNESQMQKDQADPIRLLVDRFDDALALFAADKAYLPINFDSDEDSYAPPSAEAKGRSPWVIAKEKRIFLDDDVPHEIPAGNNQGFITHSTIVQALLAQVKDTLNMPSTAEYEQEKLKLMRRIQNHLEILDTLILFSWKLFKTEQRKKFFYHGLETILEPLLEDESEGSKYHWFKDLA